MTTYTRFSIGDTAPKRGPFALPRGTGRMKIGIHILLLTICVLASALPVLAADPATSEIKCPEAGPSQDTSGICAEPGGMVIPSLPEGSLPLLFPRQDGGHEKDVPVPSTRDTTEQPQGSATGTVIYFFWGQGCQHCKEEKAF